VRRLRQSANYGIDEQFEPFHDGLIAESFQLLFVIDSDHIPDILTFKIKVDFLGDQLLRLA